MKLFAQRFRVKLIIASMYEGKNEDDNSEWASTDTAAESQTDVSCNEFEITSSNCVLSGGASKFEPTFIVCAHHQYHTFFWRWTTQITMISSYSYFSLSMLRLMKCHEGNGDRKRSLGNRGCQITILTSSNPSCGFWFRSWRHFLIGPLHLRLLYLWLRRWSPVCLRRSVFGRLQLCRQPLR